MKKNVVVVFISCMLIILASTYTMFNKSNYRPSAVTEPIFNNIQILVQESREEQFKNLFITLFMPYVDKAISDFYNVIILLYLYR